MSVVSAYEPNPPEGVEGLQWRLLTLRPVETFEDCLEVVRDYKLRWGIELLFKSAKSGCAIESCRLQHVDNIIRYLAVMFVIAWRIAWMVHVNRENPKGPWFLVLTKLEYETLWLMVNSKDILSGNLSRAPPENAPWGVREISACNG